MSDTGEMRASDADRDAAAVALRDHFAAGRLTAEELSDRLDGVYAAATVGELEHLRRDLPPLPVAAGMRRAEVARRQAELRRRLLQRAGGSLSPFAVCTLVWAASGASNPFWPVWLLIFPAMFLARNGWRLYGPAPELDRVQAELEGGRGRHRRHGRRQSGGRSGTGPRRELR